MKLLLTSAGMNVEEEIIKVLPQSSHQLKIAHIITPSKPEININYVRKDKKKITELGNFDVEDIDIEGKNEEELRRIFINKDAVFVQGGNTFYLLKQARMSGFDKVIKELVYKGLLYIGISAGTYITCPTIEQASWKNPNGNRYGLIDLTAFNLVPFLIFAHYTEDHRLLLEKAVKTTSLPVVAISDTQAVFVEDNIYKIVGTGPKVFFNGFKETVIDNNTEELKSLEKSILRGLKQAKKGKGTLFE